MAYLRVSVTDRCNLRCSYCMPRNGIIHQPQDAMLSFEEILRLLRVFAALGIKKIRLTGGEPLVRRGIIDLTRSISQIEGVEEVCITTNGILLPSYADSLKKAGIKSINISLDTLQAEKFKSVTGSNCLNQVFKGIDRAKQAGFDIIKLNVVIMKGINDDEIIDFVNFAQNKGLILRFIEFMKVTPLWKETFFMPIEEVEDICRNELGLERTEYKSLGPAEYYRYSGGIIGFIKTHSQNCRICSRLRLTAAGELKLCLYQPQGISLRDLLRQGVDEAYLKDTIDRLIILKEDIDYTRWDNSGIYMCSVGG